jgi:DNA-binding transcriptional regulator YdaS (Cro superfamily)
MRDSSLIMRAMTLHDYIGRLTPDERRAFCRRSKTSTDYLSKILSGTKNPGLEKCVQIEKASGGAVRCESLNPSLPWRYLRNR